MKKLLFIWNRLRATFWFVPALVIFFSTIFVILLLRFENIFNVSTDGVGRFIFVNDLESARNILTTISGAMIGVAGTVFSMTLVAITLTSQQLGSRQIKNFMYDKLNQIVLGSYISTFVCCLIILNSLNKYEGNAFIPYVSIMFATLLAIVNIILLIVFIHHVAISIQADTVVAQISEDISNNLMSLFPQTFGEEDDTNWTKEKIDALILRYPIKQKLIAANSGYIQYIDAKSIINTAKELDLIIDLDCRPGDYMVKQVDVGYLFSKEILGEDTLKKLQSFFITGDTRTTQQDAEHSVHQLVEIASRALSPGINDPYTAIACVDNLTKAMVYLLSIDFPSKYRLDEDKNLRIISEALTFEGMLDAAFNQIRQFSNSTPSVAIRLMEALITIDKFTESKKEKEAVIKHAEMILRLGQNNFSEPNDVKDLEKRAVKILGNN